MIRTEKITEKTMALHPKSPSYRAQLLRMWVEQPGHHPPTWRFSLEDVSTGKRQGFADLDALICHLLELMDERPETMDDW
jgi:hypothetical protein